jgi:hypothetical protein
MRRRKPVIVVQMLTDSAVPIAASYVAKSNQTRVIAVVGI